MYVKKLKDHQIADIMRVISDPDAGSDRYPPSLYRP